MVTHAKTSLIYTQIQFVKLKSIVLHIPRFPEPVKKPHILQVICCRCIVTEFVIEICLSPYCLQSEFQNCDLPVTKHL